MISRIQELLASHLILVTSLLYLLFRLPFLTLLPVFSDEALYMEWGWRAVNVAGQAFHSLHDAKQPFLMWLFGVGQNLFPDPLWGSRLVSVITGWISLRGLIAISEKWFYRKATWTIALLYISIPFFVFFDRQALMESALVASSIWSLYFLLNLAENPKLKFALLAGVSLGLGLFVKNTAILFIAAFIFIVILESLIRRNKAVLLIQSLLLAVTVMITVNLPLFLQPQYWSTLHTNTRWTYSLADLFKFPVFQWFHNIVGNFELSLIHLTPPLFLLLFFGIWLLIKSRSHQSRLILLWLGIPFVLYLLTQRFMNFMAFRYLTPMLPLAVIPIALAINYRFKFLIWFVLLPAIFSSLLILNPIEFFRFQSRLTDYSYIDGYVTGFDTGYQVNEIVRYFKKSAQSEPIFLGIAVHSFNPESGIWNYFRKSDSVTVSYFDSRLFDKGVLDQIDCFSLDRPFYFLAKLNDTAGLEKYFEKVVTITNSYNSDFSTVYTLKKNCQGKTVDLTLLPPITH